MELIFKKDKTKKHICNNCDTQFNWNDNGKQSWVFGKIEYRTIQEQKEHQKVFCSTECKNEYKNKSK